MTTADSNIHQIENARKYLVQAERSYQLGHKNGLGEDDVPPLLDEDVPDAFWLGAVALFITEDGLDGDAIVARNQAPMLAARAAGFTVGEIAEFAVMETRGRLR